MIRRYPLEPFRRLTGWSLKRISEGGGMRRVEVIMAERRASALAAAAVWLVVLAALIFMLLVVVAPVSRVELQPGPPVTPATASPPVPYQGEASDD